MVNVVSMDARLVDRENEALWARRMSATSMSPSPRSVRLVEKNGVNIRWVASGGDACAVVGDIECVGLEIDVNKPVRLAADTLDRVLDNVGHYPLDQHGVELHYACFGGGVELNGDVVGCEVAQRGEHGVKEPVEVGGFRLRGREFYYGGVAAHKFGEVEAAGGGTVEHGGDVGIGLVHEPEGVEHADHASHGVVDLMANGAHDFVEHLLLGFENLFGHQLYEVEAAAETGVHEPESGASAHLRAVGADGDDLIIGHGVEPGFQAGINELMICFVGTDDFVVEIAYRYPHGRCFDEQRHEVSLLLLPEPFGLHGVHETVEQVHHFVGVALPCVAQTAAEILLAQEVDTVVDRH